MILEGEIKDAKMTSFSSDFQTLIKHNFFLYFLYTLLMSMRALTLGNDFYTFSGKESRHQGIVRGMGCQLENKHTIWYQIFFPIRSDRPKMEQNLKTERKLQK